jgi:uncharacterized protein YdeI (YjbR/CyaY-like superfamily)
MAPRPRFFATPAKLRAWFEQHHATGDELLVGYHKVGTGTPSVTWAESVDEALCFGWIDGVRRSIDSDRYTIRFTPRRARSIWSQKNLARYRELDRAGRVTAAGRRVFEARDEARTRQYSFEQERAEFTREQARAFRAHAKAWKFFQSQPPSYRKPATWWVVSANKEETRARRLATLIADSAAGLRVKPLRRSPDRDQMSK